MAIGHPLEFILNVEVDLRGTTTAGQLLFTSEFYLSLDEEYDDSDVKVRCEAYWEVYYQRTESTVVAHTSSSVR